MFGAKRTINDFFSEFSRRFLPIDGVHHWQSFQKFIHVKVFFSILFRNVEPKTKKKTKRNEILSIFMIIERK